MQKKSLDPCSSAWPPLLFGDLVRRQLLVLALKKSELVKRWGYSNISKGLRRLDEVSRGFLVPDDDQLVRLATALEVPVEALMEAIGATRENLREEQASAVQQIPFEPHGFLIGSEHRPTSITMYCFSGGSDRWLKIPLDIAEPPISYVRQALALLRATPVVPFHGKAAGFVINYSQDRAVRFDVSGDPFEVLSEPYVPGHVLLEIGGRQTNPRGVARLLGVTPRPCHGRRV